MVTLRDYVSLLQTASKLKKPTFVNVAYAILLDGLYDNTIWFNGNSKMF